MTELTEEAFYARFRAFLHEHRPDLPADVDPETQLWDAGYLDSFALIETLTLLEELTVHPIEIGADDRPIFFTMRAIYESFVAGAGAGAASGSGTATA